MQIYLQSITWWSPGFLEFFFFCFLFRAQLWSYTLTFGHMLHRHLLQWDGKALSSCQLRSVLVWEGVLFHLALLLCARQVVKRREGVKEGERLERGEKQGWRRERGMTEEKNGNRHRETAWLSFSCQSNIQDPLVGIVCLPIQLQTTNTQQLLTSDSTAIPHKITDKTTATRT